MAHPQNPATPNTNDTPPDPEFFLRAAVMGVELALAALHRGNAHDAAGLARAAAEVLGEAEAALRRPSLAVIQ